MKKLDSMFAHFSPSLLTLSLIQVLGAAAGEQEYREVLQGYTSLVGNAPCHLHLHSALCTS